MRETSTSLHPTPALRAASVRSRVSADGARAEGARATHRRRVGRDRAVCPRHHRAFTLTELLVAVVVLIVIILATSKIFATASKVTRFGQANADLLQTATALERQIRHDLGRLSHDGFLVIRSYSVPNNVRRLQFPGLYPAAPLLDPSRGEIAQLRSDQLLFFVDGVESTQQFVGSAQVSDTEVRNQQTSAARILYSHGVQFADRLPLGYDPGSFSTGAPVVPWSWDDPNDGPDLETFIFYEPGAGGLTKYNTPPKASQQRVLGTQPAASSWMLVRQQVLLGDDGGPPWFYRVGDAFNEPSPLPQNGNPGTAPNSAPSLWPAALGTPTIIAASRVDVAALTIGDVRSIVTGWGSNTIDQQRAAMGGGYDPQHPFPGVLSFPRAEREAPSMRRPDQMLVSPAIAAGCSSFIVEWTYAHGVGDARNDDNELFRGVRINTGAQQPWFGLYDSQRGVRPLGEDAAVNGLDWGQLVPPANGGTIWLENVESGGTINPGGIDYYAATFGYNQSRPFNEDGEPDEDLNYTPWPTALRFTVTLHDPRNALERGREFQFVVDLPKR